MATTLVRHALSRIAACLCFCQFCHGLGCRSWCRRCCPSPGPRPDGDHCDSPLYDYLAFPSHERLPSRCTLVKVR